MFDLRGAEAAQMVGVEGIVLAKEGGALGKMLPMFQIFVGGPLGTGQQWCSWIHRFDSSLTQTDAPI